MDKFEEMMQKMEQKSPEEKKQAMAKNQAMCICAGCPSYSSCMKEKDELLFCATKKSTCSVEMKGCICPNCPVTGMMGLKHAYYCTKGSEKEIRGI
ncbi:MAG: DUF2769 domain-containing protein [Methanoregulaceae archaeon]|jgi:hypothetical protein|nr:DUF2769 domain-containing protein [Methanoregulaceae archaeon]